MSDNLRTPEPPNPLDVFLHRPYSELFAFIYEEEAPMACVSCIAASS